MRFNQIIFMSDILESSPDEIIRGAANKRINTMIVAVPRSQDNDHHKAFLKRLSEQDVPFDCFLPNFDVYSFRYALAKTKELGCNRLWVKVNDGQKQNLNPTMLKEILVSPAIEGIEIGIISQAPYFFRPGATASRLLEMLDKDKVIASPIITLDFEPSDMTYMESAFATLAKYKIAPTLYYEPESRINEKFADGYVKAIVLPPCRDSEINFMNWKGTKSPGFNNVYVKFIPDKEKNPIGDSIMATATKKNNLQKKTFPRKMIVSSRTLGKRTMASLHSSVLGNLRAGDVINVSRIFVADNVIFAEVISEKGSNYFVIAESKEHKNIHNV